MVDLFLFFKESPYCCLYVYVMAVSVYIPTNSVAVFPFLHILSSIYCS